MILLVGSFLLTCKNRLPYNLYCVGGDQCRIKVFRGPRLHRVMGPYPVSPPIAPYPPEVGHSPWKGPYLLKFWRYRGKCRLGHFTPTCRDNGQLLISHNKYLFWTNSPTMCVAIYSNIMTLIIRGVNPMGRGDTPPALNCTKFGQSSTGVSGKSLKLLLPDVIF